MSDDYQLICKTCGRFLRFPQLDRELVFPFMHMHWYSCTIRSVDRHLAAYGLGMVSPDFKLLSDGEDPYDDNVYSDELEDDERTRKYAEEMNFI